MGRWRGVAGMLAAPVLLAAAPDAPPSPPTTVESLTVTAPKAPRAEEVADQAAMMALARAPAGHACGELATIVDADKANCPRSAGVDGLTAADRAYLKALYSAPTTLFLHLQTSEMATRMRRELAAQR